MVEVGYLDRKQQSIGGLIAQAPNDHVRDIQIESSEVKIGPIGQEGRNIVKWSIPKGTG